VGPEDALALAHLVDQRLRHLTLRDPRHRRRQSVLHGQGVGLSDSPLEYSMHCLFALRSRQVRVADRSRHDHVVSVQTDAQSWLKSHPGVCCTTSTPPSASKHLHALGLPGLAVGGLHLQQLPAQAVRAAAPREL